LETNIDSGEGSKSKKNTNLGHGSTNSKKAARVSASQLEKKKIGEGGRELPLCSPKNKAAKASLRR